jgi:ADP-ribosylglycohydrolase
MRTAPVGLVSDQPFNLAVAVGALTHGHPTGYLAAGCLAQIIWSIARDTPLPVAIDSALEKLRTHPGHEETSRACELAVALADSAPAAPETIEQIGAGWVAEEALAIALFSALAAESFEHGVRLAVNHGGDSDSTGAIAGNLLGLLHGRAALPSQWLNFLELRQEIEQVATDLYDACIARSPERLSRLSARYPGY